jgi:hypothetical protein
MTAATYKCAMRGLWRGRAAAHTCMDTKIGFSRQCTGKCVSRSFVHLYSIRFNILIYISQLSYGI